MPAHHGHRDADPAAERPGQPAVKVPGPRGALRALASRQYDELVLVPAAEGGVWPLRIRPDYRAEKLLEFYGIGVGCCRAYLDGPDGPSEAAAVEIREGALTVASFAPAAAPRRRELILLRGGHPLAERATVLASYHDGFGVLLPWQGDTCVLPSPFGVPDRVAARIHPGGPLVTVGAARRPCQAAGHLLLELDIGAQRIVCRRDERTDAPSRSFRLGWSGPVVGQRLSCLRANETTYPPCAHTTAIGGEGDALVIDGVGPGDHLVGVGGRGAGTYTLWRTVRVGEEDCLVALAPPPYDEDPKAGGDARPWSPRLAPAPGDAVVLAINRSTGGAVAVRLGATASQPVPPGEMRAFAAHAPVFARATVSEGDNVLDECIASLEAGDLLTVEHD